jgi:hypothetical protein
MFEIIRYVESDETDSRMLLLNGHELPFDIKRTGPNCFQILSSTLEEEWAKNKRWDFEED